MKDLSLAVMRNHGFRRVFLARMCIAFVLQSQAVIVGWQIYSLTKSPFMLGLTGLVEAVPALVCSLFAGHVVDTHHPYKVFVMATGLLALNTLALCLIGGGFVETGNTLLWIYAGIFISGIVRSFIMPSNFALLPRLVSRDKIPAAIAWNMSGWNIASITGPAVAGLLYGGYGSEGAWLFPAFFMLAAFAFAVNIHGIDMTLHREKREAFLKSVHAGWKFIWNTPVLLSVMVLDMFAVLLGGATAMLPAVADQVLNVGSEGLGALRAAPAIGSIAMSIVLVMSPLKNASGLVLLWVVAGFGFCMIGFGLSTSFYLSMAFLMISGVFDCVSVVIRGMISQLMTPDHMRGRVSSVSSMFIISSNELGAFESGTAARLMGLVPSIVFGGIMTLGVVAATTVLSPKLRKTVIESNHY